MKKAFKLVYEYNVFNYIHNIEMSTEMVQEHFYDMSMLWEPKIEEVENITINKIETKLYKTEGDLYKKIILILNKPEIMKRDFPDELFEKSALDIIKKTILPKIVERYPEWII